LRQLQWQEEPAYARLIAATPKGSYERAKSSPSVRRLCAILQQITNPTGGRSTWAFDRRYGNFVLQVLARRRVVGGRRPRVFEIATVRVDARGTGPHGVDVGGSKFPKAMHDRLAELPEEWRGGLLVGSYLEHRPDAGGRLRRRLLERRARASVPDEVPDSSAKIHDELAPGGCLVTLTPNWHLRPSDVTRCFRPLRTRPKVFISRKHARETTAVLRAAGFAQVGTPLFVTRGRIVGGGKASPA